MASLAAANPGSVTIPLTVDETTSSAIDVSLTGNSVVDFPSTLVAVEISLTADESGVAEKSLVTVASV